MKASEGLDREKICRAFSKRVKAIRGERQITSERLSELCEVSSTFMRQIECASRLPSLLVLVRMCNQLHVAPSFFLGECLLWDEEDEIAALDNKLRALSPHQFRTVIGTINTLIGRLAEIEEP